MSRVWLIILLLVLPTSICISTVTAAPAPGPTPAADCPSMCGDMHVPYPFGIGKRCSLTPGFAVTCNETTSKLYMGNMQIASITLETAETVVYTDRTFSCTFNGRQLTHAVEFSLAGSPFLLSPDANMFTAIGCSASAKLIAMKSDTSYLTGCLTTCSSVAAAGRDGEPCRGLGCCEAAITPGLTQYRVNWTWNAVVDPVRAYNPCQFAFIAQKGWYNFSRADLETANISSAKKFASMGAVPLVLDWAIRNQSCPATSDGPPLGACVSANSECIDVTDGNKAYFCNCSHGYTGNPYIPDGCTNINECKLRKSPNSTVYKELYPCKGGTCHDTEGGYECKCNFGRRGDGKSDKGCEPILPLAAVVVIGIIGVVSFVAVLLMFIHMEREKTKHRELFNRNGGELLKSIQIKIFTEDKLDKVTKNYSNIIGRGGFGQVYLGTTDENMLVAVKRSIKIDEAQKKEFFVNEITIQSQLSHKNLVKLLGCCLETDVPMLVYQYIPKGSLYDVLHGNTRYPLPLETRLNIAVHSAEALEYMHVQASQKVLHGDVKSGNILLDDHFMPKVSDFGISRLLSLGKDHTNVVIGDISYMDPVYMKTGRLTEKSDVYSFGIVLLELITRKKVRYDDDKSLTLEFIKSYKADGGAKHMYDNEIIATDVDIVCVENVGLIALQCLKDDVDERPFMTEVVKELERVRSEWFKTKGPM